MNIKISSASLAFRTWYKSVDHWTILIMLFTLAISFILISSASPEIAKKISLPQNYFIYRQSIYLLLSLVTIFVISLINDNLVYTMSYYGLIVCIILLIVVLLIGPEIKGATRWISIFGISIQPSEFVKPFFVVVTAHILSSNFKYKYSASLAIYLLIVTLFLNQPDFSMSLLLTAVWVAQLFTAGISYILLIGVAMIVIFGIVLSYYLIPHIKVRVFSFIDSTSSANFQINKSLSAFKTGKLTGAGPGEGSIKFSIPDCHTDFIFAVAVEEFGAIFCAMILLAFGFIMARMWYFAYHADKMLNLLIITGLLTLFGLQFFINIGVTLGLLPTTGIALPFISYGGSSLIATSILFGMVITLTKNHRITKRIEGF